MRRKPIPSLGLIFIVLILASPSSYSQSIEGRWTVDFDSTVSILSGNQLQKFQSFSDGLRYELRQKVAEQFFDFGTDGRFLIGQGAASKQGSWSIDGDYLVLDEDNSSVEWRRELISVGSTEIHLRLVDDSNSLAIFHEAILVKSDN